MLRKKSFRRPYEVVHLRDSEKVFHFIVLVLCVFAMAVSLLLKHEGQALQLFGTGWPLSCTLYQTFGIKCALCGLTRSFCSMARGELFAAIHFHPIGPAVFIFVCLQIPYRIKLLLSVKREQGKLKRAGVYAVFGLSAAVLMNWLIYLGGFVL